jgi:uncharacterized glyoxalase superfamily protein PhnB
MPRFSPVVTPTVVYRDPLAALRWLENAFGFETCLLVMNQDGSVGHAEMSYRDAVIGVAGEWAGPQLGGARMVSPETLDGQATQFLWISLPSDIDGHCERARTAGARITQEPEDQHYGARTYRARDPEGHVWCFSESRRTVSEEEITKATGLTFKSKLD